ncbi:putative methionine aminopeptidase 2b [Phaeomoniella chlamydospora]|uniref:Methionine aminopeptidase 2 n=1 Tax=Phaeomoniella chlamydospora TaxID=158046 RepID=A0A0G2GCE3_PHACM|nr:putative methionine aminopeptidase 2b [Phaeomoniella chlamydospora]
MGSKTPEANHPYHDASPSKIPNSGSIGKPSHATGFAEDDLGGGDDDDEEEEADDYFEAERLMKNEETGKKKKRKNKAKRKKRGKTASPLAQSSPPRVALSTLNPSGIYPEGEIVPHLNCEDNTSRTTAEEVRYLSLVHNMDDEFLSDYRQAAEVHRQVRQWIQQTVKPGHTMSQIAQDIEDGVRALTGHDGLEVGDSLKSGMGFPTGLCLNNVAAHWTPNPGGKEVVLKQDDVMKVDFGVHVNGRIVDSAFTMAFDPVYDNLLASVKEATNKGIKEAGIDARMSDIGSAIQEVMESYEVVINGKVLPIKAVRNITGHDIKPYCIHGDKQIPFVKNSSNQKMEEGEVFAIETFGTTGRGYLRDDIGIYGYGREASATGKNLHLSSARSLLKTIDDNFGTIVFCRRYLERLGVKNYLLGMNKLISNGIVQSYAPLVDLKGSYVAQFEHTILLRNSCKEVISRGNDY